MSIRMSRRQFVANGIGLGLAGRLALAGVRDTHSLEIGIGTYSYHGLSIDDMIVQLNALRVGVIEMSRGEFMVMSHPADDLFRSTRAKLDRAGIKCVSYYSATIVSDKDLDDAIRFAKLLGSANITGDATGPILHRIDQRLTEEGLTFGLHNHYFKQKFAYERPEDVMNALDDLSKTMGATADTGHFASCGYDPAESADQSWSAGLPVAVFPLLATRVLAVELLLHWAQTYSISLQIF